MVASWSTPSPVLHLPVPLASTAHIVQPVEELGGGGVLQTWSSPAKEWVAAAWDLDSGRSVYSTNGLGKQSAAPSGTVSLNPGIWANMSGLLHPYAEVSTPLGVHLHPAIKKKIRRGTYVSLSQSPGLGVGQ